MTQEPDTNTGEPDIFTLLLTPKMTAAKAVETSVTSTNSLSEVYTNLDDQLPQICQKVVQCPKKVIQCKLLNYLLLALCYLETALLLANQFREKFSFILLSC